MELIKDLYVMSDVVFNIFESKKASFLKDAFFTY